MAACGNNNAASSQPSENGTTANENSTITVTIDIDFPDESNVADIDDAKITVKDGSSVLDVINSYADSNKVEISIEEINATPYIASISGVAQTDTAGWIYEVNDEMVLESADKYIVKNNDKIEWDFESFANDTAK